MERLRARDAGFVRPLVMVALVAFATAAIGVRGAGAGATAAKTRRVGVAADGSQLSLGTELPRMSGTGRFIVFASKSRHVVEGDENNATDVFLRDRLTKTNELISVSTGGVQGNAPSFPNAISPDGRFVVFTSPASTFAEPDVDPGLEEALDVFLRDRELGTTERISVNSDEEPAMGPSFDADVSNDGRFVSFESGAGNLDPADDNGTYDIFVRDRTLGTTEAMSVRTNGTIGNFMSTAPTISGDGRFVVFDSSADNLVNKDTNLWADSFVHDREEDTTRRISVSSTGEQAAQGAVNPEISADGTTVLLTTQSRLVSGDTNKRIDAYVHILVSGKTHKVSRRCSSNCFPNAISDDGRYVVFVSRSPNVVSNDTNDTNDYFWTDRVTDRVERVSVSSSGVQVKGEKGIFAGADISSDGRFVVFESSAYNLVRNDTNNRYDTFLRGPLFELEP